MATVDGYTKAGADAAFAAIGHTHAPSGGGSSYEGHMVFAAASFDYLKVTGKGTQITPASWSLVDGYSHGPDGSFGAPDPAFAYIDGTDNRLYAAIEGVYLLKMNWRVDFPNSVPTLIQSYLNINNLDPKSVMYHPAAPARPNDFTFEGNFPNNVPHTVGEHGGLPPFRLTVDDWFVLPALWWNTEDDVVSGTTYPGPIPTMQIQITKVG